MELTISLTDEQKQLYQEKISDLLNVDIFQRDCIGYWAYAVWSKTVEGDEYWLIAETSEADEALEVEAVEACKKGDKLPKGYHSYDRDMAEAAVTEGILKHGIDFINGQCDMEDDDGAIQETLLGRRRYG